MRAMKGAKPKWNNARTQMNGDHIEVTAPFLAALRRQLFALKYTCLTIN
jgi:hypothetical protein